jgi:hypothetical protein
MPSYFLSDEKKLQKLNHRVKLRKYAQIELMKEIQIELNEQIDKLSTAGTPEAEKDIELLKKLKLDLGNYQ